MQIFLLGLDNTTHTLDVDASTTLSAIKVNFLAKFTATKCIVIFPGCDRSRRRVLHLLRIQGPQRGSHSRRMPDWESVDPLRQRKTSRRLVLQLLLLNSQSILQERSTDLSLVPERSVLRPQRLRSRTRRRRSVDVLSVVSSTLVASSTSPPDQERSADQTPTPKYRVVVSLSK